MTPPYRREVRPASVKRQPLHFVCERGGDVRHPGRGRIRRGSLLLRRKAVEPGAAPFHIDLDRRRRESRIGEGADRDRDHAGPPLDLVEDGNAAGRAEMMAPPIAAVRAALERPIFAFDLDLLRREGGVPGEGAAGATLAVETVADRDPHGIALDMGGQRAAAAARVAPGHGWFDLTCDSRVFTPRAAWRMRCSFSTRAMRT